MRPSLIIGSLFIALLLLGCTQPQGNSPPTSIPITTPTPIPSPPSSIPTPTLPLDPNTVEFPATCIEGKCVHVQVAQTEAEKQRGLMGVTFLADTEGMLFVWDEENIYPFWMKDTLIPLDMVWINAQYQVVDITTMQPCTTPTCPVYSPAANAQYVLETRAGLMEEWNVVVGQSVQLLIPAWN